MHRVLESGENGPGIQVRRIRTVVAGEPFHELRIAIVRPGPGTGFDMDRIRRIGREPVKVVHDGGKFETGVRFQPLDHGAGVRSVVRIGAAAVVVAVRMEKEKRRVRRVVQPRRFKAAKNLAKDVRVDKGAETAPGVLVPDIAFRRDAEDGGDGAVDVGVLDVFGLEEAWSDFRPGQTLFNWSQSLTAGFS